MLSNYPEMVKLQIGQMMGAKAAKAKEQNGFVPDGGLDVQVSEKDFHQAFEQAALMAAKSAEVLLETCFGAKVNRGK